jgi:dipeptidyl aminopeptidase/acylaminoacyl peptidase
MPNPRPTLTELYQLERLRWARLLPHGAGVVFIVSRVVNDVERFDVRAVALDGSGMRTVAGDLEACGALSPSPDGAVWAFMGKFEGKPQIGFMNPETGAVRAVTTMPQGVGGAPIWSPCGEWLAFTAVGEERAAKGPFDPVRTSSIFHKLDGVGMTQRAVQDIHVMSRAWCEVKRLTRGPASHGALSWSPVLGRTELCFMVGPEAEGLDPRMSVGVMDLEGQIRWVRQSTQDMIFNVGFAGDGERLLLCTPPPGRPLFLPTRLYTQAAGADPEVRTEGLTRTTGGHVVNNVLQTQGSLMTKRPLAPAGCDHAFVCSETAGRSAVQRVALSGPESCVPITATDGGNFLIDASGTHVLTAVTDHNTPPDLWVCDHQGQGRTRLTALNEAFMATHTLPSVHELAFHSADGAPLQAWLVQPAGATGPVPTYLDIHGGPQCAWGPSWWLPAQMLAAAGIATLLPNPRGSSGYGEKHVAAIFGSFVQPADGDVLAAVDEAVRLGLADPDRLAVGGVSYGGTLTAWLLGQTQRFKCAIPEQLIANLVGFYGTSDAGRSLVQTNFGVSLKDGRDVLWNHSPLAHAHQAATPSLIIQCENDQRCPMGEAEQFFMALKEAGCPVELLRIPGSSHAGPQVAGITKLSRPRDEAVLDWLTRHLLN